MNDKQQNLVREHHKSREAVNLFELWDVFVARKMLILIITTLSTIIAATIAVFSTPIYRADSLLAPVLQDSGNSFGAMADKFGGLGSIAGINLNMRNSNTEETIAILKSRDFLTGFIEDEKMKPLLYREKWDDNLKIWKDGVKPPSLLDAYELFRKSILKISTDKSTGLVTLAVEWKDPKEAADWVIKLVKRINEKLRDEAKVEVEKSIGFLEAELQKTSVIELSKSIYSLIEAQTKTKMLANTKEDYAFRVIDSAVAPEKIIRPKRALIVLLGVVVGFMLGVILAFLINFIQKQRALINEV